MYNIEMKDTPHDWSKQNLVTIMGGGPHDIYKCNICGITGRSYTLGYIQLKGSYSDSRVKHCLGQVRNKPKEIEITRCMANGKAFENILPGSKHLVIDPPNPYRDDSAGVWVMGNGEPVKVLNSEFIKLS